MDLPISDKELATIISALRLGGDTSLYQKLNKIKEVRDANPGGPYKKILREQHGMVIWMINENVSSIDRIADALERIATVLESGAHVNVDHAHIDEIHGDVITHPKSF